MKDFKVIKDFKGYINKKDVTNVPPQFLVTGSKNVIINDGEKVVSRKGYSILGAQGTSGNQIESEYVWNTSTGTEIMLRSHSDELEIYTSDLGAWTRLKNGWTSVAFDFTTWWDTAENIDLLIFVAQDSNLYEWSGAITTIASTTTNTITKNGTSTWAEDRFLTAGTRKVTINGTEYTYTGGEGTTTLTGVTPDPSGEAADSNAIQSVITQSNKPGSGLTNDVVATLNNHLFVGDYSTREVFVSSNTDYTDFTFSADRLPGEGATLTFDSALIGMHPQEDQIYFTCGKSDWYQTLFTLSDDTTKEALEVKKLKTVPQGAAQSKDLIESIKNQIVFISNEPTLDTLGRIENIVTPQSKPLSDPIKIDFEAEDFTGGDIKYWKNKLYITTPATGRVWIYDIENKYWNPPQYMSVNFLSIFEGDLYGHSSSKNETYKLFDGTNDNGAAIEYKATFAYRLFDDRSNLKNFDEYYSEFYSKLGLSLTLDLLYDYKGSSGEQSFVIDTSNEDIRFDINTEASIGKESLGKEGLGSFTESLDNLSKYRHYAVTRPTDFFEYQATYSTSEKDAEFEILAHGPNARLAGRQDNKLRS